MMESTILSNLVFNRDYTTKVFPFIKEEYFDSNAQRIIFDSFAQYFEQYSESPSIEALQICIENRRDLNETVFKEITTEISNFKLDKLTNQEWLVDETEKFCQNKDLFNSIRRSILIMEGKDKTLDKGAIPKLLSDSLGIVFDSNVGHDFLEDVDERYDYYHRSESRLPFDLDLLNVVTKGGLPPKSLTLFLATTGAGKSLAMCHCSAANLQHGKNVLYISMELPEEEVARRIDANILDITVDEVKLMPRDVFNKKIERVKSKTPGRLFIKEFPTGYPHVGHFKHMLNELKQKQNFEPDIIYVDYLNIMASSRIKGAAASNSYTLIKSIAEEVRGLAMEIGVPIVSASQLNRSGYENTDVDLTNTSESMGITHTADAIFALITSEELESMGQLMVKQLKNRFGDLSYYRRFVLGIDRSRMKLYNTEQSAQQNVSNEPADASNDSPFKTKLKNVGGDFT